MSLKPPMNITEKLDGIWWMSSFYFACRQWHKGCEALKRYRAVAARSGGIGAQTTKRSRVFVVRNLHYAMVWVVPNVKKHTGRF